MSQAVRWQTTFLSCSCEVANNTASDEIHPRTTAFIYLSCQKRLKGSEFQMRNIVGNRQSDLENQTKITRGLLTGPLINVKNIYILKRWWWRCTQQRKRAGKVDGCDGRGGVVQGPGGRGQNAGL